MAETITITDNRTNQSVEIPIENKSVASTEWMRLLPGIWFYDPGLPTTAATSSTIAEINGNEGMLRYRGYPIEQLGDHSTYTEVTYLLLHGELPTREAMDAWNAELAERSPIHEQVSQSLISTFQRDAHPMAMLSSSITALFTLYPESRQVEDPENRMIQVARLIAKMPTLAAAIHRHRTGQPFVPPNPELNFVENFLTMMFAPDGASSYELHPSLVKAMDVLFILHADHGQNCSTTATRVVGSSHADPYSATAAGIGALFGPRHGGANEAVLRMLSQIGSLDRVDDFIESVKSGSGRLMGFGHRIYKNYDPRARIIKEMFDMVFAVTASNPMLEIARKLEERALADDYFVSRKLYPNVDFYSGLIYEAIGFPVEMFTVLFAIPRVSGWMSHWNEMLSRGERIVRPCQVFTGSPQRDFPTNRE